MKISLQSTQRLQKLIYLHLTINADKLTSVISLCIRLSSVFISWSVTVILFNITRTSQAAGYDRKTNAYVTLRKDEQLLLLDCCLDYWSVGSKFSGMYHSAQRRICNPVLGLSSTAFCQSSPQLDLQYKHCAKKPVTTMLTYPWECTVLRCNHLETSGADDPKLWLSPSLALGQQSKCQVISTRGFQVFPRWLQCKTVHFLG